MDEASTRQSMRRIFAVIPPKRKVQGVAVLFLMLAGAIAELMTIGAVIPFLAIVSDPTYVEKHKTAGMVLSSVGLSSGGPAIGELALLFCAIVSIAAAIRIGLAWASQKYVFRIGFDLGVALYQRVLFQPYTFHAKSNSANVVAAINKVQQIINHSLMPLMQAISSSVIAVFIIAGLVVLSAPTTVVAIGLLGLIYVAVSFAARERLRRNSEVISNAHTERVKSVQEGLGAIRDVILDHSQSIYLNKFIRVDTRLRDAQATNALIAVSPRFVIEALGMVTISLLALHLKGEHDGLTGALPVLGALALGAQRLLPLMQQTYNGFALIAGNKATLASVLDILEQPLPAQLPGTRKIVPLPFHREIAFENVDYRYDADGPLVIHDLSFRIAKGMRVGFVGETGSGKSTTLDLLMGLLLPTGGKLTIDGVPLEASNLTNWQVQIAHVPQVIYLTDASLLENIAFSVPKSAIVRERVYEAARQADIHEFIVDQPLGYDATVGERGLRLSGGQRQRIGIARALYKQATVLVLDEATSALDDRTETSIMQSIERLPNDVTVIIVAHRVTTLRSCDVIHRLRQGTVDESGSYHEVIGEAALPRST